MRLLDEGAQLGHLVYEMLNAVAAGLVDRPADMPGIVLDWGHWLSGGIPIPKPPIFFGPDEPAVRWLRLTPPPLLYLLFRGDMAALVHHMRQLTEHGRKAILAARSWPAMGAAKLVRLHPWSEPTTFREPGGRLEPSFKLGARGMVGREIDRACRVEVHDHRQRTREAFEAFRAGDREVEFPYGAYKMVVGLGARMEDEPPEGAIVAAPGPTLAMVREELEGVARGGRDARRDAAVDEVREAFDEEAEGIVEDGAMRFPAEAFGGEAKSAGSGEVEEAEDETGAVHVQRPRDRRPTVNDGRRVVVLRDREHGGSGRSGGDPPG